jgi:hypothetical protein
MTRTIAATLIALTLTLGAALPIAPAGKPSEQAAVVSAASEQVTHPSWSNVQ